MINKKILDKFLKMAGDRLSGDWILIGGCVLPVLGIDVRVTVDIDFIGKTPEQQTQMLELMNIVAELGLPVETINQAGAYYLTKIEGYDQHLCRLHKGKKATIYTPDLYLFLKLKLARFTESDYIDCLEYIDYSKKQNIDSTLIRKCKSLLKSKLAASDLCDRILQLIKALEKK